MIPTVQFDPATLAIWTTTGTLPEDIADVAAKAMSAAAHGDDLVPIVTRLSDDDLRLRVIWLASCVWHEKRHFFDFCLTNYGARRFRDLFMLAANSLPLIAEAKGKAEPVWFPVEVYGCPVRRRIFGISEPRPHIKEIARKAQTMKRFAGELDAPAESQGRRVHLGGEAQLEGLAMVSQMNAIEHRLGLDDMVAISAEHVHRLPREGPYRAIETVAGMLGCFRETEGGNIAVDVGLASAVFITALCGRFMGAGRNVEAKFVVPLTRLTMLIEAIGPTAGKFGMSGEAAWEIVDKAARSMWGRTAFEEIEAEIDRMEAASDFVTQDWMAQTGLTEVWADFIRLRRRVLSSARAEGPASILPGSFSNIWLDRLLPWHVVATPGGDMEPEGATMVFGRGFKQPTGFEHLVPKRVAWGRLHEAPADRAAAGFAPTKRDAWLQMLEQHAPRARLMLNGRRHRLMVPPELERPIEEITEMGVDVRFMPDFEYPENRDPEVRAAEALMLAEWGHRKTFICDVTGDQILVEDAALLTPWEFRRSPLAANFRKEAGADWFADLKLAIDWSDWVVRQDLLP